MQTLCVIKMLSLSFLKILACLVYTLLHLRSYHQILLAYVYKGIDVVPTTN